MLCTDSNGILCPSFKAACVARGFVEECDSFMACMQEAVAIGYSPSRLRRLFVILYMEGGDVRALLRAGGSALYQDHIDAQQITGTCMAQALFLADIRERLTANGQHELTERTSMQKAGFGDFLDLDLVPTNSHDDLVLQARAWMRQHRSRLQSIVARRLPEATNEQRAHYNVVINAVKKKGGGFFFIQGKAGRGKSTLMNLIAAQIRSAGYITLATALTGVAALDHELGHTSHTMFKIPVTDTGGQVIEVSCGVDNASARAELLRHVDLIFWDEMPMSHRFHLEAVDRLLGRTQLTVAFLQPHTRTRTHARPPPPPPPHTHTHTHTHTYTHMHTHTYTHIHTHAHAYIHTHVRTHTCTHIRRRALHAAHCVDLRLHRLACAGAHRRSMCW